MASIIPLAYRCAQVIRCATQVWEWTVEDWIVEASLERTRHLALGLGLVSDVDALIASLQELREKAAA